MVWNQALLRRFCSTGHFRLLNQVRSELRNNPLLREQTTRDVSHQDKVNKQLSNKINKRTSSVPHNDQLDSKTYAQNDFQSSFRERLDAIDMR